MGNDIIQLKSPDREVSLKIAGRREIAVEVVEGRFWLYFDYPSLQRVSPDRSTDPKVISVLLSIVIRADLPGIADITYSNIQRDIEAKGAQSDYRKISADADFEEFSFTEPKSRTVEKIYFTKKNTKIQACFEEVLKGVSLTYRYNDELDVKIIFDKGLSASRMQILDAVDNFISTAVQKR